MPRQRPSHKYGVSITKSINHSVIVQGLNFPDYSLETRLDEGDPLIFDPVRKKWVALQPEEWVRQHVVHFLRAEKHFPDGLITIEQGFDYQGMPRRADLVAHGRDGRPVLLVECKAPDVPIDQSVFDQVALYNQVIRARYLFVTNGLTHYCSKIDWVRRRYEFIDEVPDFRTL